MSLTFLNDPSFWILVSFLLLISILSTRALKGLRQQLETRQETIARQIAEVSALYEEAKNLLSDTKISLESKEKEALLIKAETLKEIERKKKSLVDNIKKLHQRHEDELRHKMEIIRERHAEVITKKIITESCLQAENELKKTLSHKVSNTLIKNQIEKTNR
jgi:F0F1-type ATP synthase membrane subunit b/b'